MTTSTRAWSFGWLSPRSKPPATATNTCAPELLLVVVVTGGELQLRVMVMVVPLPLAVVGQHEHHPHMEHADV